ncbi:hypothetical protein FRC05_009946 [Tulasnella sp. 425]|nr:hypothetical protein FRC05_009946 [Tulasnella sp. 425]
MKKPAVQYGKKAQRIAARKTTSTRQSTPDSTKSTSQTPAESADSESEAMEVDEPAPKASTSKLPSKESPSRRRSPKKVQVTVEIPAFPRRTSSPSKAKERLSSSPEPELVNSETSPTSPARRRISAATTLASQLKRKATLEEISSGIESDDPLLLVETPRKRVRAEQATTSGDAPSPSKRLPTRLVPIVEVDTPERLFGRKSPTHKKSIAQATGGGSNSSPKGPTGIPASQDETLASPTKGKTPAHSMQSQEMRTPPKQKLASKMLGRAQPNLDGAPTQQRDDKPSSSQTEIHIAPLIFPSASNARNTAAPTSPRKPGIAKRMLTRTGTEPDLGAQSTSVSLTSDTSLRAGPSTPSKRTTPPTASDSPNPLRNRTESLSNVSPQGGSPLKPSTSVQRPDSPPPSRPTARTYAKSRSFLVDLSENLLQDPDSQGSELRESYQDLRARWGMDQDEDDLLANSQLNDLRTGIELKNKGETRRFLDELGYLFEGLEPKEPLSVRRSSALEFVEKMADPAFRRKARVADVLDRAWDALIRAGAGTDGDVVLRVISIAFAAFVSEDERDIGNLSHRDGFMDVARWPLSLDRSMDPFMFLETDFSADDAKRAGIGKAERRVLRSLQLALESDEGEEGRSGTVLARRLSSQVIKTLPTKSLDLDILEGILGSLVTELNLATPRIEAFTKSLPLWPPSARSAPDLHHIENCLKILERCLFGRWGDEARKAVDDRVGQLAPGFVALIVFCELVLCDPESDSSTVKISDPTSSNPPSSETGIETDPKPSEKNEGVTIDTLRVDIVCYALALLTNVLQHEPTASASVGQSEISVTCSRARTCIKSCRCLNRTNALASLISIYEQQCSAAADESNAQAHFLRGHLAFMLGFLAKNESNRTKILSALPGESEAAKLDGLIEVIKDFMILHTTVTAKMAVLMQRAKEAEDDEPGDDQEVQEAADVDNAHVNSVAIANSLHSGQRDHEAVNAVLESLIQVRRKILD